MRTQCCDLTKRNSRTTTLPLKLERSVVLPEGSEIVNSGDLRGTGADGSIGVEIVISKRKTRDVNFRICIVLPVFDNSRLAYISLPASICQQCAAFPLPPQQHPLPGFARL